ncbi:pheromone-regulated protein prm10 [Coemansia sp. RSA 2337]|nr:pheromone-regulated protein prm10 [Coemansia sp. RSA 2337]
MSQGADTTDLSDSSSEHIPTDLAPCSLNPESTEKPSANATDITSLEPSTSGFSPHRFFDKLITSATHHIQGIELEPTDQQHATLSNVGQIKLRPDPAILGSGKRDIEAGQQDNSGHRPGLLSQYLRLMHLDRKSTPSMREKDRSQEDMQTEWVDTDTAAVSTASPSGLRRRKGRLRSTAQSWRPLSRNTTPKSPSHSASGFFNSRRSAVSPISTPLSGVPFRHLSEALPWASSHRVSACCTPALTRRPSVSSVSGDLSTMERLPPKSDQFAQTPEQQNIMHAIDLLLLHQRFLILIAKALMVYGSPLHYLEDNLGRIARLLDLEVTVSAIPGLILISFEDSVTHTSETKVIRCANGWDMHRLDQTNQLLRRVVHAKIDIPTAVPCLEEIMTAAPIYAWYWQVLNWGVISWTLCLVCFGGSWQDSGISLALGLMAGCLNLAAQKFSGYTNFFEVSVSILTGLFGAALSQWGCFGATSLSATVVLLPGLVMTTGVIELSSRHMIAGTVRVFYALLLAFIIAYGLLIGVEIYNQMAGHQVDTLLDLTQCKGLSKWTWFGSFPLGIISISVLVNIHWRHWFSVIMVAGVSYGVFWLFKFHLMLDDLAPVVASFVLGLVANIWSKFTGQTAYMILLPGEMFLVPGSVGVRGFSSLLSKNGAQGAQLAMQMITTCLSIMIGLFASTFLVYPRGKQHSAILTV